MGKHAAAKASLIFSPPYWIIVFVLIAVIAGCVVDLML